MHSLRIVQWNFTRRDHPGNPKRVSGSGPVIYITIIIYFVQYFKNIRINYNYFK